ncbi:MAG: hypothetical protein WDZ30_11005 [Cellvibrionaceae bacterium]
MRQEVNLYTIDFRRGDQPLSSRLVVRGALMFFALLMVVEGVTAWQLLNGRDRLAELGNEQQVVSARLQTLKDSRPFSERARLEAQIDELRAQVRRREELRSIISGQKLGNSYGFSPFIESMARQANGDISLTRIRLLNGGDYLELGGATRKPESVPLYLNKLRGESSFYQVKFGTLVIERSETGQLRFRLGKDEEGPS